jgi:hypothetical protein
VLVSSGFFFVDQFHVVMREVALSTVAIANPPATSSFLVDDDLISNFQIQIFMSLRPICKLDSGSLLAVAHRSYLVLMLLITQQ